MIEAGLFQLGFHLVSTFEACRLPLVAAAVDRSWIS
jgi:hypothetical protein